jgi:hypothetical protein
MKKLLLPFLLIIAIGLGACSQNQEAQWQEQYDLGIRYLSEGNYEEAIIAFTTAIEIDPKMSETYLALGNLYIELGDYEAAAKILEQGVSNTNDTSLQELLDDVKKLVSIDFDNLVSDAFSYTDAGESSSFEYHIPKINIDDAAIAQLNQEIYAGLEYDHIASDIAAYGFADHSASYQWSVNGSILSLVTKTDDTMAAWTEYSVYNISILDGTEITDEELVSSVGLSMDDYYIKVEQALGSKYWKGWDRANEQFQNNSFCEMFNAQLENTISQENLRKALPYLNSEGQLCIIAPIYSMAGADYYYHELNLSDLTLIPDYKYGVEIQAHAINISQEEAYQIACDYWDFTPGDVADETGFELFVSYDTTITSQNSGKTYYCYLLRWMVDAGSDTAHLSTCDWVYIDAESGECSFEAPK